MVMLAGSAARGVPKSPGVPGPGVPCAAGRRTHRLRRRGGTRLAGLSPPAPLGVAQPAERGVARRGRVGCLAPSPPVRPADVPGAGCRRAIRLGLQLGPGQRPYGLALPPFQGQHAGSRCLSRPAGHRHGRRRRVAVGHERAGRNRDGSRDGRAAGGRLICTLASTWRIQGRCLSRTERQPKMNNGSRPNQGAAVRSADRFERAATSLLQPRP